jgi:hypothetical protein
MCVIRTQADASKAHGSPPPTHEKAALSAEGRMPPKVVFIRSAGAALPRAVPEGNSLLVCPPPVRASGRSTQAKMPLGRGCSSVSQWRPLSRVSGTLIYEMSFWDSGAMGCGNPLSVGRVSQRLKGLRDRRVSDQRPVPARAPYGVLDPEILFERRGQANARNAVVSSD